MPFEKKPGKQPRLPDSLACSKLLVREHKSQLFWVRNKMPVARQVIVEMPYSEAQTMCRR